MREIISQDIRYATCDQPDETGDKRLKKHNPLFVKVRKA